MEAEGTTVAAMLDCDQGEEENSGLLESVKSRGRHTGTSNRKTCDPGKALEFSCFHENPSSTSSLFCLSQFESVSITDRTKWSDQQYLNPLQQNFSKKKLLSKSRGLAWAPCGGWRNCLYPPNSSAPPSVTFLRTLGILARSFAKWSYKHPIWSWMSPALPGVTLGSPNFYICDMGITVFASWVWCWYWVKWCLQKGISQGLAQRKCLVNGNYHDF